MSGQLRDKDKAIRDLEQKLSSVESVASDASTLNQLHRTGMASKAGAKAGAIQNSNDSVAIKGMEGRLEDLERRLAASAQRSKESSNEAMALKKQLLAAKVGKMLTK